MSYPASVVGQGFRFSTNGSAFNCGANAGNVGTNDFTLSFWFNSTNTANRGLFGKTASVCGYATGWFVDLFSSGRIRFWMGNLSPAESVRIYSAINVCDGQWHHVAVVRSNLYPTLYVDGRPTFGGAAGISANASASKTISGTRYIDFLVTIIAGASSQSTVMITTTVAGTEEISGRALGPLTSNIGIAIKAQALLAINSFTLQSGNGTYVAGTTFVLRVSLNNPATSAKALSVNATLSGLVAGVTPNATSSKTISGAVADEIRTLSDKTSASAKDISLIVKTIQAEIRDAAHAIVAAVKKVLDGKTLITRSGDAMGSTLEAAQHSSTMAKKIEKASEEQSDALNQIKFSMENIRMMIEQVAKATDEERKGSAYILESIGDVKEVAELVKKGTQEHATGTEIISKNMDLAMDMVSQISRAAREQVTVNESITRAVEQMRQTGTSIIKDMGEVMTSFGTLTSEVEILKKEMELFKTAGRQG